jgi:preprotein translocase subunit SecB
MMDKTKQPGIRFDGIILSNINFNRKPDIPNGLEIKVNFIAEKNIDDKNGTIKITTALKMEKNTELYADLEMEHVGLFSTDSTENMAMEEFLECNGPALMFPYIRECVTDITCKAGMNPVILPPMNIVAMLKENETCK